MTAWLDSDNYAAAIHASFALPVLYTPHGGIGIPITAVFSDIGAPNFNGPGATVRTITWEVLQSDVGQPDKGDVITGGDDLPLRLRGDWSVEDVTRRDDVASWELIVEKVT